MNPLTDRQVGQLTENEKVPPSFIVGACLSCGKCCEFVGCSYLDKETKKCKIYKYRPIVCRTYPQKRRDIREVGCKGFKCLRG